MSEGVVRIILFAFAAFFAWMSSIGGFQNPNLVKLIGGIAISALAGVTTAIVLKVKTSSEFDIERIADALAARLSGYEKRHFRKVGLNFSMGEQFWKETIKEMGQNPQATWMSGTKLRLWLEMHIYKNELKRLLTQRVTHALQVLYKNKDGDQWRTYILLVDKNYKDNWSTFLKGILEEVKQKNISSSDYDKKEVLNQLVWLGLITPENSKYSAVLCGSHLVITPYVSRGRAEESPVLDIFPNSPIYDLYKEDLNKFKNMAEPIKI